MRSGLALAGQISQTLMGKDIGDGQALARLGVRQVVGPPGLNITRRLSSLRTRLARLGVRPRRAP
jgi:hypothetical protein